MGGPKFINRSMNTKMKNQLPIISFYSKNAIDYATSHGFKVGKDIDPLVNCNHLDHDGHEFLAEAICTAVMAQKGKFK